MDGFKRYIKNGGKKDLTIFLTIGGLIVSVLKMSFSLGEYNERFTNQEQYIRSIENIKEDIATLKAQQEMILKILEGKYGERKL
jgi:hypothetical protein